MSDKEIIPEELSNINKLPHCSHLETELKNNVFAFNQSGYSMPVGGSNELSRDIETLFHKRLQRQLQ